MRNQTWRLLGLGATVLFGLVGCDAAVIPQPAPSQPTKNSAPAETTITSPGIPEGARFETTLKNFPPTGNRVELTLGKITLSENGMGQGTVHYRFTAGWPDAAREYSINTQFLNAPFHDIARFPGKELKAEGTLEWQFQLPAVPGRPGKPSAQPREFEMRLQEEESRDGRKGYSGKSDAFSGTVTAS